MSRGRRDGCSGRCCMWQWTPSAGELVQTTDHRVYSLYIAFAEVFLRMGLILRRGSSQIGYQVQRGLAWRGQAAFSGTVLMTLAC